MRKKATAGLFALFLLIALSALGFQKFSHPPAAEAQSQSSSSSAPQISSDLSVDSEGPEVVELQNFLEARGLLTLPPGVAKGYFGNLTQTAVATYQASQGLPSTGYFGPLTRGKVNAELPNSASAAASASASTAQGDADAMSVQVISSNLTVNSEGPEVVALQNFLESQGFLVMPEGISKGFFGNRTLDAVVAYQASQGLPVTGDVSAQTKQRMNVDLSANKNATGFAAVSSDADKSTSKDSKDAKTKDDKDDDDQVFSMRKVEDKKDTRKNETKKKKSSGGGGSSSSSGNSGNTTTTDTSGTLAITVSVPLTCEKTSVTWNKKTGVKYEISRATKKEGPYTVIAKDITESPYNDYGLDGAPLYYYRVAGGNEASLSEGVNMEDCFPIVDLRGEDISKDAEAPDYDEPGDVEELHDADTWKERGEEPGWMMFGSRDVERDNNGDPISGGNLYTPNVRALIAPQPSPTQELTKVPLNIDGEWDGETYVYLYPEESTPPLDNAKLFDLSYLGGSFRIWGVPDTSEEKNKTKPYQYDEQFVVPYLIPAQVIESDGSDVGPGTFYPIAVSEEDLMKWFWKVKTWKVSDNISYTRTGDRQTTTPEEWSSFESWGHSHSIESSSVAPDTEEEDLPYLGRNLNFSTYEKGVTSTLYSRESHSYEDGRGEHPTVTNQDSEQRDNGESIININTNTIKKVGDVYYPEIRIHTLIGNSDNYYIAHGTSEPGISIGHFNADIAGYSVPIYYERSVNSSSQDESFSGMTTVSGGVSLTPVEYWTYGGKYDEDTGEPVDSGPGNIASASVYNATEGGFIQNILAKVKEYVTVGITKVASALGVNEQGTANILTALRLQDNQIAAGSGGSRGWRLTNAAVSWFGGCEDVNIDAQGYATRGYGRKSPRLYIKGKPIKFPCGHRGGGTRYLEPTAFDENKLLWTYQTNIQFYAAYPLSESLEPQHRYSNSTLLSSCMVIENAKTGKSVKVDIIDRGPNLRLGRKIDMSKATQAYLGLTDGVSRVNASLVSKGSNGPCTPPLMRPIR